MLAEDIEESKIRKWLPFKATLRHWKNWKSKENRPLREAYKIL